jgi:hypothetical protein
MQEGIVLNNETAKKAHVRQVARTDMEGQGAQNRPEAYTGIVDSIKIGKFEFRDCYVDVAERVSSDSTFNKIEGSITAGMFAHLLVDINAPAGELELSALPAAPWSEPREVAVESFDRTDLDHDRFVPPELSSWTPIYRVAGCLLLPVKVNGSPPKLFEILFDSGRDWVSIPTAQEFSQLQDRSSRGAFDSSGFLSETFRTGPITLDIAGRRFKQGDDTALDFGPASDALGLEVSGDLGYEFLRNVDLKIDYRDGLIDIRQ